MMLQPLLAVSAAVAISVDDATVLVPAVVLVCIVAVVAAAVAIAVPTTVAPGVDGGASSAAEGVLDAGPPGDR